MDLVPTVIIPDSEQHWLKLRTEDLTSTDTPALFNISPYMTRFELWHRKKKAKIEAFEENERMKWGTRLQNSIAAGIAQDNDWKVRSMTEYMRLDQFRIGSSFDFAVTDPFVAILEIKNVDSLAFKEGWIADEADNIEAPVHIELQVQHQLLVSGLNVAYIGALVGGNKVVIIKRTADLQVQKNILEQARLFWQSIDENKEPEPDFKRDAKYVLSLYQNVSPEKVMAETEKINALAVEYELAHRKEKELKAIKESAKAEIISIMGDAEKVKGDKFSINAGYIGPVQIEAYERVGYRNFKLSWKKEKAQ